MDILSQHLCHGGSQGFYTHQSEAIGLPMRLSVYLPPQAASSPVPAAIYLAGLTCTEETFMIKAGAQRVAAALGLALVAPDTSPRGAGITGEDADWDLGTGAGFYLDATQEPWRRHYRMASYVAEELPVLLASAFPIDADRLGLFGHSMGGHGALTLGLTHPGRFRSLSALAPICAPSRVPWGRKAFAAYLGDDHEAWRRHDACELIRSQRKPYPGTILVDQGLDDPYLGTELRPDLLEAACAQAGQQVTVRRHTGYDHGYYFISTFIADHLHHHAAVLGDV
ncbi:S-formylglutathione hydrolase [Cupriavidus sp. WGlv3]|uniref:S-formylglutathione hydrolase n=1 Tax=Cupriavidus sp. WGlv3 TaxID=2919924 RepID=UPI002090E4DC|nr:S-formylglutathione hydrolase [Cupriavidus sp. WGlv3]MCO4863835.1 S-formylglutathione hydrolase [Cupriavidus sp. WGlv3]